MTTEYIYVLLLQNGKYYVGRTNDVSRRFREHRDGTGTAWTQLHPALKILRHRPCLSPHDEATTTLDVMREFGIDNVRGGIYCNLELSMADKRTITRSIHSAHNECYICGRPGHLASACNERTHMDGSPLPAAVSPQRQISPPRAGAGGSPQRCFRCGQPGHYKSVCFASTRADGSRLPAAASSSQQYASPARDGVPAGGSSQGCFLELGVFLWILFYFLATAYYNEKR